MLYNENMHILYPLQIFKMRKKLNRVYKSTNSNEDKKYMIDKIYNDMERITKDTLINIDKAYDERKITLEDYDDMTTVIENIWSYYLNKFGEYKKIEEVKHMVKSFYDPKVEERGIEKGIKKGIEKGIEKGVKQGEYKKAIEIAKSLLDVLDIPTIAKKTGLSEEEIETIVLIK